MAFVDILGYGACAVTSLTFLPQVIKTWKEKSAKNVSLLMFIIAFVTAVGGGTLRDIMIGRTPVGWMLYLKYVYVIIVGFVLAIIFRKKFDKLRTSLFLFDTIGLGVFTLIGLEKGINIGLHPVI